MAESFVNVIGLGLAYGGLFEDLAGGCKSGNHFGPTGFHDVVVVDGAVLANVWSVIRLCFRTVNRRAWISSSVKVSRLGEQPVDACSVAL